jgi:LmbE family N-acetylglucosaminyl deacetylase
MRYIYLSPHLDDAALSVGGWIYDQTQQGNQVEIWTLMCGFPTTPELSDFAKYLHHQWGMSSAEQVVSGRRKEDINSAKQLGASVQHFDFLDCIYRRDQNGNWLYSTVFVEPLSQEDDLPQQIAKAISARLTPDAQLLCQLSIGKHVDHVLVRRAAELLGKPLFYVADIPYLFNTPEQLAPNIAGLKENVSMVSEAGLQAWFEAISAYESQVNMLFQSTEAMRRQISEYCQTNKGLRFWSK